MRRYTPLDRSLSTKSPCPNLQPLKNGLVFKVVFLASKEKQGKAMEHFMVKRAIYTDAILLYYAQGVKCYIRVGSWIAACQNCMPVFIPLRRCG